MLKHRSEQNKIQSKYSDKDINQKVNLGINQNKTRFDPSTLRKTQIWSKYLDIDLDIKAGFGLDQSRPEAS